METVGGEVVLQMTPLDLSPEAQAIFGRTVFRVRDANPGLSFEDAYASVLETWNLDCPHVACVPTEGGSECLVCKSVIVNL